MSSSKTVDQINEMIKSLDHRGDVSDGYHTFNELYDHRCNLYIAICNLLESMTYLKDKYGIKELWKSWKHADGSAFDGWFILGIETDEGQITYHLPGIMFHKAKVKELAFGKEWDGHTSKDVLLRLDKVFSKV